MGTGRLYDYWVGKYSTDKLVKVVSDTPGSDISAGDAPQCVLVSSDGHLVELNYSAKTLEQRSLSDGSLLNTVSLSAYTPYCLCEDGNGDYFVGVDIAGAVLKVSGSFVSYSVFCDMSSYGYTNIRGLFFDDAGNLYPIFTGQNKVGKISSSGVFDDANTVTVGTTPWDGLYYNGARYITNFGNNTVSKVVGNSVMATINVGTGPRGICRNSAGKLCVCNSGSGTASIIQNDSVIATPTVGTTPYGCGIDKDGDFLIVNNGGNSVSRIGSTNTVTATISVTDGTPRNHSGDMTGMKWELLFGGTSSQYSYAI